MLLHAELLDMFNGAADNAPRSLQRELGPSEYGDPCERKLAYKMFEAPETTQVPQKKSGKKWRATVGTAIHKWAETEVFDPHRDYEAERKVTVGAWFDGERARILKGSCDAFYLPPGVVIDLKTSTKAKIVDYQRSSDKLPGSYIPQVHGYGQGYVNEGYEVHYVALLIVPRDDELNMSTSVFHIEEFDPTVPAAGLKRLESIAARKREGGYKSLPMAQSFCSSCSWFYPSAGNPDEGRCPGVFSSRGLDSSDPFK